MANDFRVHNLIVGNQYVTSSGSSLYISGQPLVSGFTQVGGGSGIVSGNLSGNLITKTLIGGSGIRISGGPSNDTLIITVTGIVGGGGGSVNSASNLAGGSGWFLLNNGGDLQFRSVIAGTNLQVVGTVSDNYYVLNVTGISGAYDPYQARFYV